ncbi:hypothetical protein BUALT_Bualt07G0018800 [Buddleja alternifolia]|uniref:Arabidopsis retrotransposon Orf1 C-terminal domain-containing protein n=1 Tax=Buddleja alternifolia TaxID=168488 RepID=A0AAV6XDV1_9LAMI|nr:hypothetical protein BUALT_Bualt07G0018800 [Buddleja alternifolia]
MPLVIAFSTEQPISNSTPSTHQRLPYSGDTAAATPPAAVHADSPWLSSPTISSGFSSSSQSPDGSPPQCSRLGKGKSVLPPSSKLGGFTTFKSKVQQKRYNELCRYPIIPSKCVDYDALNALNIRDEFVALVDGIGWSGYFHVKFPAFIELTREFYTTFKFNKTKDLTLTSPGVVKFRLMGKEFSYSINQFNVALGFVDNNYVQTDEYKNSSCDYLCNFRPYQIWDTISTDTTCYHPNQSKSSYLREPVLKYIQRFLAYNYSGRKDSSGTFTKAEFYFIWMGIVTLKHRRPNFTSPEPTVRPKKRKLRDTEEPTRDTISSTPETSNIHSFSRHFEDRLNRIETKLDRILAHFRIPPD